MRSKLSLQAEASVLCALRSADEKYGRWYVDFGKLPRDAGPQTKSIVFERGDGGPLDLKVLGFEPPLGSKDLPAPEDVEAQSRVLERGERYAVDITIKPPWPGPIYGRVRVSTGVSEQPEDEIDLAAMFEARLTFSRDPPRVPRVRREPFKMKLTPTWSADQPPGKILSAESTVPGLQARVAEEAGAVFILVEVAPECNADTWWTYYLTLRTDDPAAKESKVLIPFEGFTPRP